MMYLVFLVLLYKLRGGSIRSFIKSAFGHDIDEDQTPTTPSGGSRKAKSTNRGELESEEAGGYASDGGIVAGAETLQKPLALFGTKTTRGGTFSGTYQQVAGDEEIGRRSFSVASDVGDLVAQDSLNSSPDSSRIGFKDTFGPRSISVTSDGNAGARVTSISVNSDGPLGTTSSEVGAPSASLFSSKARVVTGGQGWFSSVEERNILKRRTIRARLTPMLVLSSFVSDLDLVTDWCFWYFGLAAQPLFIRNLALFFAIVGSVMWALATTEFSLMSKLRVVCRWNPLGRLQHVGLGWQLLTNVILEDVPQFLITVYTKPTSVTGVLNLSTSALSLLAKTVHGVSAKRAPSLSTQFKMIDQDPVVTRNLFKLRDEAKKKAAKAEHLVYLAWKNRCSAGNKKAAPVFQILQIDPTFVHGDLEYMRADLFSGARLFITSSSLTGPIPREVGNMGILRAVILSGNQLTGTIPVELGNLRSLEELNLSDNRLTGPIPAELGSLSVLEVLVLSGNALSGEIPANLSNLNALEELDLSHNKLTGLIPDGLGNLKKLRILSVASNMLSGVLPTTLGTLSQLKSLVVKGNMLTGVEESEPLLKTELHPDCNIQLSPQREEEHVQETT